MTTLTGKTVNYVVSNETEGFKLSGTITMIEDESLISNFNGSFSRTEGGHAGNFYYSENKDGKVNKSINDVASADILTLDNFFNATISELKNLNDDNE